MACFLGRPLRCSGPGLALISLSDASLLQVDTPEESIIALKGVGSCAYASAQKERAAVPRNGNDGPRLAVLSTLSLLRRLTELHSVLASSAFVSRLYSRRKSTASNVYETYPDGGFRQALSTLILNGRASARVWRPGKSNNAERLKDL